MALRIPSGWKGVLGRETEKPYYQKLMRFLEGERAKHTVYPPEGEVFSALRLTPYEKTKALILGQDPYHDDNQAHGLAFSVRPGVPPPPSLVNIFKELKNDVGFRIPNNGYLAPWGSRGCCC
jgi:uracil-DNA glycosylase